MHLHFSPSLQFQIMGSLLPHSRCFGSYFDVIFSMYLVFFDNCRSLQNPPFYTSCLPESRKNGDRWSETIRDLSWKSLMIQAQYDRLSSTLQKTGQRISLNLVWPVTVGDNRGFSKSAKLNCTGLHPV